MMRKTEIDPKTSQVTFYVPCGYLLEEDGEAHVLNRVTMREMAGREEDLIADERMTTTQRLHAVVANCVVSLSNDEGREVLDEKILRACTRKMLMSDIVVCLFRLREVTVGDEMRIKAQCTCSDNYGAPFSQTHILSMKEFDVVESKGNPKIRVREFTTSHGQKAISWEMMSGEMELRLDSERQRKPKKRAEREAVGVEAKDGQKATQALLARVRTIDGVPATVEGLRDLPFRDRQEIRRRFDEEGGINTDVSVVCRNCGREYEVSIGMAASDFFIHSEE